MAPEPYSKAKQSKSIYNNTIVMDKAEYCDKIRIHMVKHTYIEQHRTHYLQEIFVCINQ